MLIFAAGAATAVLAGGLYSEPIKVGEFHERAVVLIAELEALSPYIGTIEDGRVGIYENPVGACLPPTPPRPNLPKFAVDPYALQKTAYALATVNEALMRGEKAPIFATDKCKPYEKTRY